MIRQTYIKHKPNTEVRALSAKRSSFDPLGGPEKRSLNPQPTVILTTLSLVTLISTTINTISLRNIILFLSKLFPNEFLRKIWNFITSRGISLFTCNDHSSFGKYLVNTAVHCLDKIFQTLFIAISL